MGLSGGTVGHCTVRHTSAIVSPFPKNRRGLFAMANIKSQVKRNRQNEKLRLRNKAIRSEVKTRMQRTIEAAQSGDAAAANEAYRLAQKNIDKAVAKGVMDKNTASRRKSNLARQVEAALS